MYMPASGPGLTFIIAKRRVAGPDGFVSTGPDELSWAEAKRNTLKSPCVGSLELAETASPEERAPEVVLVVGEEAPEGKGSPSKPAPCQTCAEKHQAAEFPASTD